MILRPISGPNDELLPRLDMMQAVGTLLQVAVILAEEDDAGSWYDPGACKAEFLLMLLVVVVVVVIVNECCLLSFNKVVKKAFALLLPSILKDPSKQDVGC